MTSNTASSSEFTIPVAKYQTSLDEADILHSANCGVIVERVGLLKAEYRSEGRVFARELAEYINVNYAGTASVFVYEETFGTKDVVHWLIHVKSLAEYEYLVGMGSADEGFREIFTRERIPSEKGGGTWDRMFVEGTLRETVLLPQFTGMYGTEVDGDVAAKPEAVEPGSPAIVPPAAQQVPTQDENTLLHSANCGVLIHRVGQLTYEFRSEARQFAREVARTINTNQAGRVTVLLYEEAFGRSDRLHWLIHMKSLSSYYSLIDMRAWMSEEVREVYTRERIEQDRGGGNWNRMFLDASLEDLALTPQHWGMYTTTAPQRLTNGAGAHR
ncbi:hypothetical protein J2S53_003488 [Actinopolyspora lacussalsi]|nr:hypothetical protein [Actinopolyspora lacussalsi]